ncbi:MAG: Hpt domain-containing protein, partial [Desulfuromonadales bacterium]|nr:Hpt domain-containing protein [Desulfuromonadales bacterium]
MSEKLVETFRAEAGELLTQLEDALLALEECSDSSEAIDQAFRAIHTLKGSGAVAGFDDIAEIAHELENTFAFIKSGHLEVTPNLISLTLWSSDMIKLQLDGQDDKGSDGLQRVKALSATLRQIGVKKESGDCSQAPVIESQDACETAGNNDQDKLYLIRFRPQPLILERGINPLGLINALDDFGPTVVVAHLKDLPDSNNYNPEKSYAFWDIALLSSVGSDSLRDHFIFVEGECDLDIVLLSTIPPETSFDINILRELLEYGNTLSFAELQRFCTQQVFPEKSIPATEESASAIEENSVRTPQEGLAP